MKRFSSINTKLRVVVVIITLVSMAVIGLTSLRLLWEIRDNSERTFIDEMQKNVSSLVQEKIDTAELLLDHYSSYLDVASSFIDLAHSKPQNYVKRSIPKRSPN